jgi:hypothetical protein
MEPNISSSPSLYTIKAPTNAKEGSALLAGVRKAVMAAGLPYSTKVDVASNGRFTIAGLTDLSISQIDGVGC